MKSFVRNRVSKVALFAGVLAAAWSPASVACSDTPVLASICVMAVPFTFGPFNRQYVLAAGQDLAINNYTALYSLIGSTYGQLNNTSFKLPDLRGRFVIAADGVNYNAGAKGGNNAISLSTAQLPPHLFTVTALPVALGAVTVSTALPTLSATVNIASSVATVRACAIRSGCDGWRNSSASRRLARTRSSSAGDLRTSGSARPRSSTPIQRSSGAKSAHSR